MGVVDGNQKKCGGAGGEKSKEMWRFGGGGIEM